VAVVAAEFPGEHRVLPGDRRVSMLLTPLGNSPEGSAEPGTRRLALDDPRAPQGASPEVRETKQVEARGPRGRIPVGSRGTPECDQASLLWMQSQPVTSKPLRQYGPHPTRILLQREHRRHVVRVANQEGPASEPGLHLVFEPRVQHLVEEDVRQ